MELPSSEHLSTEDLVSLYERQRERPTAESAEMHPHLAACPECRQRLEEFVIADQRLEELRARGPALRHDDCPHPSVWVEIATGLNPPEEELELIQHASRCEHCGALLREAVSDLTGEVTEAERERVAALESGRPEWQRRLAKRIAGSAAPEAERWKTWISGRRAAWAGVALAGLVACVLWIAYSRPNADFAGRLLARAYTEQRTLELRFAGAAYAPLRVQRGPETSFADRNPALLKAESLIASAMPSHPSDPAWLQAKARADLLEGKYDAAVESSRRALQVAPNSPDLMIDLASAYFQRAQAADHPEDLGTAYEFLSRVLAQHPDDPVALFNRAIVAEHQFLYHQALEDWEHYLRVDASSEWAEEARKRAEAVRAKLQEHDRSRAEPLVTPAQIAARPADAALRVEVDGRVEEYLHEAVSAWLPQAYPEGHQAPDPGAAAAPFFLAELTSRQHGDRWLSDLLAGSSSPQFPQAVAALAESVKAVDADDDEKSAKQAVLAERLFQASRNEAGVLYAQFVRAYAAQIVHHGADCLREAAASLAETEKHPYWWLQIQLGLEKSVCSGITGNLGADQKAAHEAMERAQKAGYGIVFLRALGFVAQDRLDMGDRRGGWKLVNSGLEAYWAGRAPAMRGYSLNLFLTTDAESIGQANLVLALWREALSLINSTADLPLRASATSWAARAAAGARQWKLSERYAAEAARLYALTPQSELVRAFTLQNQVLAAQTESGLGRSDRALELLTGIQGQVGHLSDTYTVQIFYSALGKVQLSQGHYAEAEQALRPALAIAEQNLESLQPEDRLRWSKESAPIYLGLAEAELAQGRTEESLGIFEWYLGAATRAGHSRGRTSQTGLPDSAQLSGRLPLLSHQTVLACGLLPGGLAIWNYDDRGVTAQWIPGKNDEVEELRDRLYELASDPQSDAAAFRRDARSLYSLLIGPLEPRLEPGRTIAIEADESLARIPFEALLDSGDHYLVERAAVVHSPGMYADEQLRREAPLSADSPALIVASTAAPQAEKLIPLPDVTAESEIVARGFSNARVLRGHEATLEATKAGLRTAAVFHFAGHALATSEHTGLLLEDHEPQGEPAPLLDADWLRHLKAPGLQIAVLSACDTAKAGTGDASGFSSITEALLRAGVPHVVASRWGVDSGETRSYIESFYHELLSGVSVSGASRRSAQKMLSNPQTAHPYYWSAFAVYGRP